MNPFESGPPTRKAGQSEHAEEPKSPSMEQSKSLESIKEINPLTVIETFRQFGGESNEAMDIYKKWYDQQYEQMVAGKIDLAQLGFLAGSMQFALGRYEDAYATFEDLEEMYKYENDAEGMKKCRDMAERVWAEYESKR